MSGPFKMKGSSALGYGNQHSKGGMPMYDSPAQKALVGDQKNLPEHLKAKINAAPGKMMGAIAGIAGKLLSKKAKKPEETSPTTYASPAKDLTDSEKKRARYVELSKENENKKGFKEARDKAFGGPTTVKDGISTTKKPVKN